MNLKRLSKNVLFLYVRMLVLLVVMFYTSRVLLSELGVNDYGLYNVIGGFVLLFSSLRTLFSTAIQRFINYEKVREGVKRIQEIFTIGVYIHLVISLLFIVLVELIGIWFISEKLVAEPDRISAAYWVLHFSVLSSIALIMTVPYDALIIANEKMNFYAYVSVLDGVLRLLVVFFLIYWDYDKLKLYVVLIFIVSLIMRFINMAYCKKSFPECKIVKISDFRLVKEMSSFAAWNFLGNFAYSVSHEGVNILLNMFGGTSVNAARGIVYQVRNALSTILMNIVVAVDPQGITLYSEGKKEEFSYLMSLYTRIVTFIYLMMAIPLFFYTSDVIKFWLDQVPEYTVFFLRCILLCLFFRALHFPVNLLFKASGKMKSYQLIESVILISTLVISYIALRMGFSVESVFIIMFIIEFVNYINILWLLKRNSLMDIYLYCKLVLSIVLLVSIVVVCESLFLLKILGDMNFVIQILIQLFVIGTTIFMSGFSSEEKSKVYRLLTKKFR